MKMLPIDYAVRNLGRSPVRLALSVGGAMLVVLLVLTAAAFVRGMQRSLQVSAGERNVILLGAGSEESVERSEIGAATPALLAAAVPGIRTRLGVAYISPEVHLMTHISRRAGEDAAKYPAVLRGVTPEAFLVHSRARIVQGALPEPGKDQVLAGSLAAARMGLPAEALRPGATLYFDGRPWTVSGTFEAPGTVLEAELWMPLPDLQIAARRDNLSCVIATLDEATFEDVQEFCMQRLDLELVAMRETAYYGKLADFFRPIEVVVWATAGLIALGGLFGGLNTMHAAFASRVRELATLQTLGYPRRAIVLSLVQESLLAALAGALLAIVLAMLLLDGVAVRFSMGVFGLNVDSGTLLAGLFAGAAVGGLGALPPAVACLRLPITSALKSV